MHTNYNGHSRFLKGSVHSQFVRRQTQRSYNMRGRMMVELLFFVTLCSVLAIVLWRLVDPLEQINHGADAARKADMVELASAYERYQKTYQTYPWDSNKSGSVVLNTQQASEIGLSGISELVVKNELKPQFGSRQSLLSMFITQQPLTNVVSICFAPESKNFREQATKNKDGTPGCTIGACYICTPE